MKLSGQSLDKRNFRFIEDYNTPNPETIDKMLTSHLSNYDHPPITWSEISSQSINAKV